MTKLIMTKLIWDIACNLTSIALLLFAGYYGIVQREYDHASYLMLLSFSARGAL